MERCVTSTTVLSLQACQQKRAETLLGCVNGQPSGELLAGFSQALGARLNQTEHWSWEFCRVQARCDSITIGICIATTQTPWLAQSCEKKHVGTSMQPFIRSSTEGDWEK